MNKEEISGSFRDPSGFLFFRDGILYRQVNQSYKNEYDTLLSSGLYNTLTKSGLLIPHNEENEIPASDNAYKIIRPELIDFISYPYEWCFSQLKDAALTTLAIQKKAMDLGMSLKDASAYNIQFHKGKPIFIDTLSFERHKEGQPWVAYKQFCQHFLAPLALMSYTDIRLSQLLRTFIDGIPLDLAVKLLPLKTKAKPSLLTHIHLHAKSQSKYADKQIDVKGRKISKMAFMGIIDSLESAVKGLTWAPLGTEWGEYYDDTNYTEASHKHKKQLVADFIDEIRPKFVWDMGANTGVFSRIAAAQGIPTISFDIDLAAVEKNYLACKANNETTVLPLILDLTNPSPGIGWQNHERNSLIERGPVDTAMALALIHHLAISNNLPFAKIAGFFASICANLIIEFVPKEDSQVQRLLATRADIFPDYTQDTFESEFSQLFEIIQKTGILGSKRTLFLMSMRN